MPVKFTQSMSNSRPSSINISMVMDQNGSKRAREEEEMVGRRVRMKLEEAKNNFSRNQQSLLKMVEENEKITDDIIEDLEEKSTTYPDSIQSILESIEEEETSLAPEVQYPFLAEEDPYVFEPYNGYQDDP